jgi:hypothetical protein
MSLLTLSFIQRRKRDDLGDFSVSTLGGAWLGNIADFADPLGSVRSVSLTLDLFDVDWVFSQTDALIIE